MAKSCIGIKNGYKLMVNQSSSKRFILIRIQLAVSNIILLLCYTIDRTDMYRLLITIMISFAWAIKLFDLFPCIWIWYGTTQKIQNNNFFLSLMLLIMLLIIPFIGLVVISSLPSPIHSETVEIKQSNHEEDSNEPLDDTGQSRTYIGKPIALVTSVINVAVSGLVFILFHFSSNPFQFVREYHNVNSFDFYLGVDGLSVYFVLLTTIITPVALLSNWSSISKHVKSYLVLMLLLETLLLGVFLSLDNLMFYIFFESILPPLFILVGLFGSSNRVKASFYLFLYTLLGSLFLLLSILNTSSSMGATDYNALFKSNVIYYVQTFLFVGIFIAFAVKTPTIFLNTWLLKAHVESPLGGSIILAAIVLKLSLYGIFRLITSLLPKLYITSTPVVFTIGIITIFYATFSTIRTIDIKELIAYSSVAHAAVYLIGVFSNTIQGIEGGILLGLAHGFVSSGLFMCAGGVLYDRSSSRAITFYRGMAQMMPVFAILFFILCLANAGTPLTLNFIGEYLSLYGVFSRLPLMGLFAIFSVVGGALYSIWLYNRVALGGTYSPYFKFNVNDLSMRETHILLLLVVLAVLLGVYPSPILDGLHYSVSCLLYNSTDYSVAFLPLFLSKSRIVSAFNKYKEHIAAVFAVSSSSVAIRYTLLFVSGEYLWWSTGVMAVFSITLLNLIKKRTLPSIKLLLISILAAYIMQGIITFFLAILIDSAQTTASAISPWVIPLLIALINRVTDSSPQPMFAGGAAGPFERGFEYDLKMEGQGGNGRK